MFWIGVTPLGSRITTGSASASSLIYYRKWQVRILHKSGGLKKVWNIGEDNCYIYNLSFENNKFGCGSGIIKFGKLDFPIDADDKVEIYYNGDLKYQGLVDITPDPKGGECLLIPIWKRTEEILYSGVFAAKTVFEILETIFSDISAYSKILWNAVLVDTDSSTTYNRSYNYDSVRKIIDDLVGGCLTNKYWGVNGDGYFYVKNLETTVTTKLYYSDTPAYSAIKVEQDYSGITATRYQVYKKNYNAAGTVRAGEVGYGGSYPILSIENLIRRKEEKYTVPDLKDATHAIDDADALALAYTKLQLQEIITNITIYNVDLTKYEPEIGKLISVQDNEDVIQNTIDTCDSLDTWHGATLDTTYHVEGTASVTMTDDKLGAEMICDFKRQLYLNHVEKVGLMIMSSQSGSFMSLKIYTGTDFVIGGYGSADYGYLGYGATDSSKTAQVQAKTITTKAIIIAAADVWYFMDYPCGNYITYLKFEFTSAPPASTKINIDRIQLFQIYRNIYEDNVIQINYNISPKSESVTVALKSTKALGNRILTEYAKRLHDLENTQSLV